MNTLSTKLELAGINVSTLRTLRELAIEGDQHLSGLPQNFVELQFPIYALEASCETALSLWQRLKNLTAEIEYYPVILGSENHIKRHWQRREFAKLPQEYIKEAQSINAQELLRSNDKRSDTFTDLPHQGWDKTPRPLTALTPDVLFFGDLTQPQYIGFLATTISWQLPAYLNFGDWNDCPNPALQCGIHRYWQYIYQTEIVAMTSDALYCQVNSPVVTYDNALRLATEQIAYCPDLGGNTTINQLAVSLLNSTYWIFWWD